jgi:hypothetical protein
MALIYRSILEIDDPDAGFVDRARGVFTDWVRMKMHDRTIELPLNGVWERSEEGFEVSVSGASAHGLAVFRGASFETARYDGAEVETQLVAIADGASTLAWVDIDRTAADPTANVDWLTTAPNLVKRILQSESASSGPTRLDADPTRSRAADAPRLLEDIVNPSRAVPIVVVATRTDPPDGPRQARARAEALMLRLRGVALVAVLDEPARAELSRRLIEHFDDPAGLIIESGEVHAYLPGIASDGYHPKRHRMISYRDLAAGEDDHAAMTLAPDLLRRATEVPLPVTWRERAKELIEQAGSDEGAIRVRRLIAHGESAEVEFKSSLRHDIEKGGTNTALTKAITKTLAAFLNCSGGTLLIGVDDAGDVVGIERDLKTLQQKPNLDGFELCLREAIGAHLGNDVNPLIDLSFGDVEGRAVAIASCPALTSLSFTTKAET